MASLTRVPLDPGAPRLFPFLVVSTIARLELEEAFPEASQYQHGVGTAWSLLGKSNSPSDLGFASNPRGRPRVMRYARLESYRTGSKESLARYAGLVAVCLRCGYRARDHQTWHAS